MVYMCVCVCVRVCVCAYVCAYICMCACMNIGSHANTLTHAIIMATILKIGTSTHIAAAQLQPTSPNRSLNDWAGRQRRKRRRSPHAQRADTASNSSDNPRCMTCHWPRCTCRISVRNIAPRLIRMCTRREDTHAPHMRSLLRWCMRSCSHPRTARCRRHTAGGIESGSKICSERARRRE